MAPSGSTGRRTAASRGASQRTQPDTPSSDPARPPRRTAVANSPYASKEAPGKGKDKAQSPSKGKDKRTNKPAPPVKRAKKDRGAGKKQATSDDEGEAEDGEGQGMCLACQKSDKDATSVECDRCEKRYHWSCVSSDPAEDAPKVDKWLCSACSAASPTSPTSPPSEAAPTTKGSAKKDSTDTRASSPLSSVNSSPGPEPKPQPEVEPAPPPVAEPSAAAPAPPPAQAETVEPAEAAQPVASTSSLPAPASPPSSQPALRKSSRTTRAKGIDYANLDQHLPASVDRWISTISAREASGGIVDGFAEGGFRKFGDGRELGAREVEEWIYGIGEGPEGGLGKRGEGMTEPFVVERPEGLGMEMPPPSTTVKDIAELVGPSTPLEVIDCASQSSLSNWTLGQWATYYEDPQRDKIRNVISLEVSESQLGRMVKAPELVRKLDWVDNVWPDDMKIPGQYPRVQKYCLMSVERCWTDWHVDFAGSSVFYHVLRGGKTFFFIRPTPANLAAYEKWSGSSEQQEQTWLGDMVDKVYRVDLKQGNTAFIPTGWIHAVYTPADSLVIGGNFVHSLNISTQLEVYRIEIATRVPRKFRFPFFVKLLWLVALHYYTFLASPPTPLPADLRSPRVLAGLKDLSSFLIEQTTRFAKGANVSNERRKIARENVPWSKVPDPVTLSREFRKAVLKARGEPLDAECFLPHVAHVDEPAANGAGGKRKAESLEPDAQAALAAKAKARRTSNGVAPPYGPANGAGGDGEIIGRQTIPVVSVSRREERIDPRGSAKKGAMVADIRESRSTQSVVRRWEHDPLDPNGKSGPVVETRTVITIVERVKFPATSSRAYHPYAPSSNSASYQSNGIGPPAPPSITAVPGSAAAMTHHPANLQTQNAAPYSPYGWPYNYTLTDSNGYALGTAPPPQYQYSAAQPHNYASQPQQSNWNLSSYGSATLPPPPPQQPTYQSHPGAPSNLPPLPSLPSSSMPPPPLPQPKPSQNAAPSASTLPPPPFSAMPGAAMLNGQGTAATNGVQQ
ncbi:JmjC domain-containing histone demethylation protein 1 [Rhodotorula toruloides]|nr:JmjC domain-containing histone demethylation protein 1 [Rhodotorula toruloides]